MHRVPPNLLIGWGPGSSLASPLFRRLWCQAEGYRKTIWALRSQRVIVAVVGSLRSYLGPCVMVKLITNTNLNWSWTVKA